jgi:hypothetical protein
MQGHPKMFKEANEMIDMVERYEKENIQEGEDDFDYDNPDQENVKKILMDFIKEHGVGRYLESEVLQALPIVLVSRDVSYWTYRSLEHFCDQYDEILYEDGYFGRSLDEECQSLMDLKVKLQRCAKRFVARIRLAPSEKQDETCPICVGSLNPRYNTPTPCGHLFHTSCLRRWKQHKSTCPMCRSDLE